MRGKYYDTSNAITLRSDDLNVVGTMSTNHKATVNITVRPKRPEDLAPALKQEYDRHNENCE